MDEVELTSAETLHSEAVVIELTSCSLSRSQTLMEDISPEAYWYRQKGVKITSTLGNIKSENPLRTYYYGHPKLVPNIQIAVASPPLHSNSEHLVYVLELKRML